MFIIFIFKEIRLKVVQLLKICHQMSKKVYSLSSRRTGLYDHDKGDTRGGLKRFSYWFFFIMKIWHPSWAGPIGLCGML